MEGVAEDGSRREKPRYRAHLRQEIASARVRLSTSGLAFDVRLIDQQDRDVVLHRIDPMALTALELVLVLVVRKRRLAGWAGKNFKQIAADHADILPPLQLLSSEIAPRQFLPGIPKLSRAKFRHMR